MGLSTRPERDGAYQCEYCLLWYSSKRVLRRHHGNDGAFVGHCKVLQGRPERFKHSEFKRVENPVSWLEIGICRKCKKETKIDCTSHHLCNKCGNQERYKGEGSCGACSRIADGITPFQECLEDAYRIVCQYCHSRKFKYNIPSFKFLKEKIYTIENCENEGCNTQLDWNSENKSNACIDHEHYKDLSEADKKKYGKKGKYRGALCQDCNLLEGRAPKELIPWAVGLDKYRRRGSYDDRRV